MTQAQGHITRLSVFHPKVYSPSRSNNNFGRLNVAVFNNVRAKAGQRLKNVGRKAWQLFREGIEANGRVYEFQARNNYPPSFGFH